MQNRNKVLYVSGKETLNGIAIKIQNRDFKIEYPRITWQKTPTSLRQALLENLTFANTHFLPLVLDKETISYNTKHPLLESFFFKNQLYDMLFCEKVDRIPHLSYLRRLYNLDLEFKEGPSTLVTEKIFQPKKEKPVAIIPFSSGKESLVTFGLARELGLHPVLVYCQEPAQPHEKNHKLKQLQKIQQEFHVQTYYIKNAPGLFRYDRAFNNKPGTELGWASQTPILALLSLPFIYAHKAIYVLFGSENANNEFFYENGWKIFPSYDQTSSWTMQVNNMIRLLTCDQCSVKTSLEPIEEINIFYMLHHRYPELSGFQFSCNAEKPLFQGSQWCHQCYKCVRMYLFSLVCDIEPEKIGFKKNLLQDIKLLPHYFGKDIKTGSTKELDFCFYVLSKRFYKSPLVSLFNKQKRPYLKPWSWYRGYFTSLHPAINLPELYKNKMLSIFSQELKSFSRLLPRD